MVKKLALFLFIGLGVALVVGLFSVSRVKLSTSPVFLDRNGKVMFAQLEEGGFRYPLEFSRLPQFLPPLLVAAEDKDFYVHPGVDWKGVARAAYLNLQAGRVVAGGSTITQQLAHQILFPDRTGQKGIIDKVVESLVALTLDAIWSKDQILEEYLNRMYFGRLAYGIEAAAQQYFGKSATQLDLAEGSALLAFLHLPGLSDPRENLDLLRARQRYILDRGVATNAITPAEANLAYLEELFFVDVPSGNLTHQCLQQYLLDQAALVVGALNRDATDLSGLTIQTTLDQNFMRASGRILQGRLDELPDEHQVSNAATVAIVPATGEVLTYVCNTSVTEKDLAVDLAQAPRQPGSAIKPVTYLQALTQGFTLADFLHDSAQTFYTFDGKPYVPEDYDRRERGPVTVREALASSLNIPAVELLSEVGLDGFFDTARALGIESFTDTHRYDLAITLGGGEVSLFELTSVYATLANHLDRVEPYVIEDVRRGGEIIYQHQPAQFEDVLGSSSTQFSFLIADVLADNQARRFAFPEINPLVTSQAAAAKTGTTQDFKDSWTLGYNPAIAVGVWVGNADYTPMQGISGVQGAAPIWHDLMEMYLQHGYRGWYEMPDGVVVQPICLDTECMDLKTEYFLAGTEPADLSVAGVRSQPVETSTPVRITYPYRGQVFQINPADDLAQFQQVIFKVEAPDGSAIEWRLDGSLIGKTRIEAGIAKFNWTPQPGRHTLHAVVDEQSISDEVEFEVVLR